jgi:predicted nucleotidyltransferase component of viral defense system
MSIHEIDISKWVASASKSQRGFREAVHIVLTAISTSSALRSKMVMKGGLLMAIRYDSTRFTRDVDFSTRDRHSNADQHALLTALDTQIDLINGQLLYDIVCRRQATRINPSRKNANFPTLALSIGYAPRSKPMQRAKLIAGQSPTVVQIDFSFNEAVYDVEILALKDGTQLRAYSLCNLLAEKFRSLLQQPQRNRNRRQDVFDLYILITKCKPLSTHEHQMVLKQLVDSCNERLITATRESIGNPRIKEMAAKEYDSLVDEIEGKLPRFDDAFHVIQVFYESLPW